MAEEVTEQEEPVDKLERILNEEDEEASGKENLSDKLKGKKILILVATVFFLSLAGGAYWFLTSNSAVSEGKMVKPSVESAASLEEQKSGIEENSSPDKEVEEVSHFKKINVYPLEPFFIPLELKNQELVQFVNLKVVFVMSNRKLDKEIDKNISKIRKQIYEILKSEKSRSYIGNKIKIKENLKQEIVTVSNSLLSSGAGTISDVLFTNFVIK